MPHSITKTVYSFEELIAAAKDPESDVTTRAVEKVRLKLSQWQTEGDWYDYIYDLWKNALDQIGFEDAEISFSGFCSQGDGASFKADLSITKLLWFMTHKIKGKPCIEPTKRTGKEEDFLPYVVNKLDGDVAYDKAFKRLVKHRDTMSGKVERTSSRYYHELTCKVDMELHEDLPGNLNDVFGDFERAVESLRYSLCKAIYASLETEYDGLQEEEVLIDFDEANEYQWDSSGNQE